MAKTQTPPANNTENLNRAESDYQLLFVSQTPDSFFEPMGLNERQRFFRERFDRFAAKGQAPHLIGQGDDGLASMFSGASCIEIITEDHPFLLESLHSYLASQSIRPHFLLHPVFYVVRQSDGSIKSVSAAQEVGTGEGLRETHLLLLIHAEPPQRMEEMIQAVGALLDELFMATRDFPAMEALMEEAAQNFSTGPDKGAVTSLFRWFSENLILVGHLGYQVQVGADGQETAIPLLSEGLGLIKLRPEAIEPEISPFLRKNLLPTPFLVVEETLVASQIHKRATLSALIYAHQPKGNNRRAGLFLSVFTNHSQNQPVLSIPLVREKVRLVLMQKKLSPGSFLYKELVDIFNGLPRFEMFRMSAETLGRLAGFYLSAVDQSHTRASFILNEIPGSFRVLVAIPGKHYGQEELQRVAVHLETLLGVKTQNSAYCFGTAFTLANLFFHQPPSPHWPPTATDEILRLVLSESKTRHERLVDLWEEATGQPEKRWRVHTLVNALPRTYRYGHTDTQILVDLVRMERALSSRQDQLALRHTGVADQFQLALYSVKRHSLSRIMPLLTHLRVEVHDEQHHPMEPGGESIHLYTFRLELPAAFTADMAQAEKLISDLLLGVLEERLADDPLNALLVACHFNWRQISLMALYRNYLMQVGSVYTIATINETLIRRPQATQALMALFQARFDPALGLAPKDPARQKRVQTAQEALRRAVMEIGNLTEDRIFKRLLNLVLSTTRTNFFSTPDDPVVAVKLASGQVDDLPLPRPLYEIYVHGPLVEGIHLRGGLIARGGLRYSDRPDDFRTEVLGLMATQMKKNALIVPVGAKGGYVVRRLEPYGGNARAAGDAQYRLFVRALLSLTDNLRQGKIEPPPNCVCHDGPDPYLVVAADKGTAHQSDTANAISQEMGYWLGDSFASGGSQGYDHKKVGITARGAWESVKRHFKEMGLDPEKDPVRVAGIGDMSGDVFGNFMLLSKSFRLVAAFNHRHLFFDPDPEPETSHGERLRLFRLPGSQWSDYNPKLISPGGGVFERQSKGVALTPQLKALLGLQQDEMSGEELVRAVLCLEVELLVNGGIGTYIKSSRESHNEVVDHANDAVRVNAQDCRALVVAEGGNLGITQQGRIELDRKGIRLNTDAFDNSGGVDMSDHEVNLKILMSGLLARGQLPNLEARNQLLAQLEPEVTHQVLENNRLQAMVRAVDWLRAKTNPRPFHHLVEALAAEGVVDRRLEPIPLQAVSGQEGEAAIPRPVLCVLLSYAKISLARHLENEPLIQTPWFKRFFVDYFPPSLASRFDLSNQEHFLERGIITTAITNRVVNQAGVSFVHQTAAITGQPHGQVVMAYLFADQALDGPTFRQRIYGQERQLSAATQYKLLLALEEVLSSATQWLLLCRPPQERPLERAQVYRKELDSFMAAIGKHLSPQETREVEEQAAGLAQEGADGWTARTAPLLPHLGVFLACAWMVEGWAIQHTQALALLDGLESRLHFDRLDQAVALSTQTQPDHHHFGLGLRHKLLETRLKLLEEVLARKNGGQPEKWLDGYLAGRPATQEATQRVQQVLSQSQADLISLALAVDALMELVQPG